MRDRERERDDGDERESKFTRENTYLKQNGMTMKKEEER